MLIIFVMVQMRRCSDHKMLRGSVDLFNFFSSLSRYYDGFIITYHQAIGKYKVTKVKFKSSKKV